MKIYSEQQMPNFGTSEYVLHREPYYKNNFGVFLRVIVYRLFVLNIWWHRRREYQLVAKSTVPCFLTRVIFTMSVFPLWYAPPLCPELGAQRKFGGMLKKFSGALRRSLCPNFKTRVGASAPSCLVSQMHVPPDSTLT